MRNPVKTLSLFWLVLILASDFARSQVIIDLNTSTVSGSVTVGNTAETHMIRAYISAAGGSTSRARVTAGSRQPWLPGPDAGGVRSCS